MSSLFKHVGERISRGICGIAMVCALAGCLNPTEALDHRASAMKMSRTLVPGSGFEHLIYALAENHALKVRTSAILVFIEGDGTPWVDDGSKPAVDPTPHKPLAFELFVRSSEPAWYVTRPCYNGLNRQKNCRPEIWTSERYSAAVIESMAAAITRYSNQNGNPRIVLIGYSGGGTLAVSLAQRLRNTVSVVTIAANLDTDAWTRLHAYLPLDGSVNPVSVANIRPVKEIHLTGDRDTNVPPSSAKAYFDSHPDTSVWRYKEFDHVCCWVQQWPEILERILSQIN